MPSLNSRLVDEGVQHLQTEPADRAGLVWEDDRTGVDLWAEASEAPEAAGAALVEQQLVSRAAQGRRRPGGTISQPSPISSMRRARRGRAVSAAAAARGNSDVMAWGRRK